MSRHWFPAGRDNSGPYVFTGRLPDVGQVIAVVATRKAWRVLAVDNVHHTQWLPDTVTVWRGQGEPEWETWSGREVRLLLEPARNPAPNGKDRRGRRILLWSRTEQWIPLHDPYPVCVDCGLVWPCFCHETNQEAAKATGELDRLTAIKPGQCWACGETIRLRQGSISFAGENLLLPGAPPPLFHTANRRVDRTWTTCRSEAIDYERKWIAAAPDETRPHRLHCPGMLREHDQKAFECTFDGCPGGQAWHEHRDDCRVQVIRPAGQFGWAKSGFAAMAADPGEALPATTCARRSCRGRLAVAA